MCIRDRDEAAPATEAAASDASASDEGKVLNIYCWNEEFKSRVRKTAEALGYFPNAAARALKTYRSYNIGVLFEEEAGSGLTHEYFSGVLNG